MESTNSHLNISISSWLMQLSSELSHSVACGLNISLDIRSFSRCSWLYRIPLTLEHVKDRLPQLGLWTQLSYFIVALEQIVLQCILLHYAIYIMAFFLWNITHIVKHSFSSSAILYVLYHGLCLYKRGNAHCVLRALVDDAKLLLWLLCKPSPSARALPVFDMQCFA